MTQETLRWFAGIDWGSERHQACLLDAGGEIVGRGLRAAWQSRLSGLADVMWGGAGHPAQRQVVHRPPDQVRGRLRYAAHLRLRNTVYHWARVASQRDPKCRARYAALRQRGHSHARALRGVADRLLGLACVLLQRQTLFDPTLAEVG